MGMFDIQAILKPLNSCPVAVLLKSICPFLVIFERRLKLQLFELCGQGGIFTHGTFFSFRCMLRVLDSFGTEPEFNHANYAQSKGHKTPWGKWNLNPQQFYTMFREYLCFTSAFQNATKDKWEKRLDGHVFLVMIPRALTWRNVCYWTLEITEFFKIAVERLCGHFVKSLRNVFGEKRSIWSITRNHLRKGFGLTLDRQALNPFHATRMLFGVYLIGDEEWGLPCPYTFQIMKP